MSSEIPFREIDHTADAGIEVHGDTVSALFLNAARGMFSIICQDEIPWDNKSRVSIQESVQLTAESMEDLLHDWLSELLYLNTTHMLIPTDYRILSIARYDLEANVSGFQYDEEDTHHLMEIKAVTYHQLSVNKSSDQFSAQIIFDL